MNHVQNAASRDDYFSGLLNLKNPLNINYKLEILGKVNRFFGRFFTLTNSCGAQQECKIVFRKDDTEAIVEGEK